MNKNSFLKKKLTSKSQFALLLFLAFIFSLSFVNIAAAKSILIGTSADNVGIGTTAPASKLDVLGNISIYGGMGGTSGYGINLPSTSNDFISIIGENDGGDTSNGVFYTGDNEGDGWYFRERDCCGLGTGDYMRIARNGVYYNGTGNFGIGTTAPNYKLDVNGDGNFGGYQIHNVGSPSQGSDAATKSYVDSTVNTGVSSVAWSAITGRPGWLAGGSYISSAPSDLNSWMDSGFYQSDGSNTNNPVGTWFNFINVRHSNQGNYHGFQLGMSYYDNNLWWRSYQDLGTFQNWVHAISNAGGAIDGGLTVAGNVGIGTNTPSQQLEIGGSRPITFSTGNPGYGSIWIQGDTGGWSTGYRFKGSSGTDLGGFGSIGEANSLTRFFIGTFNTGEKISILAGGNVGIGLTAPSYKLDVNGDGNFRGYQIHSVGTPSQDSDAATKSYVDSAVGSGWRASGSWKPGSLSDATRLIGITSPDSGEFALGYKNGQIYPYTDGWFYQNEGQYRVLDTSDVSNLSVGSAKNAPIFISSLYGANGDFPFRTTSQSPVAMRQVYGPFGYTQPSCPSGTTKYYRVYSEFVDGLHSGGVMFRMDFGDGHTLDFNMGITWGGSPSYRTYLSGLFQEGDTNHATMYTWLGNSPTGTITADIRKVELWAYCI